MRIWLAATLAVLIAALVTILGVNSGGYAAQTVVVGGSKAIEKTTLYDVAGATLDEVRREVFTRGPYDTNKGMHFAGWTEWRIQWWFDRQDVPQGCAVRKAATETYINYTLPRWADADRAPAEVQRAWNRFVVALTLHEQGHGRLARELADKLKFAIESLPPEPDCKQLDNRVSELANHMILQDTSQEEYDRQTAHGQTQGAAFPSILVHAGSPAATP